MIGSTALGAACFENHLKVVTVLIESRATVDSQDKVYDYLYCCLNLLTQQVSFTQKGWSALHLASQVGHSDIVKLLLNYHAQLELRNKVSFGEHEFMPH